MNRQLFAVMQRRGELLAKIDAQREQVAQIGARWQAPLALADQGMGALHLLISRPVVVASVVALVVWRRRSLTGLAKTGWKLWKGYRSLSALSARLSSRQSGS
ncbi:YqjK family protein [Ferrigenium kumadai]|uniref:YqjK family protein n=1 Tax=Ferrigenium kumadai TaxID=1682490 RepID=UPI001BB3D287|nr:YqjK family protein [Ferrigenium kumadai]